MLRSQKLNDAAKAVLDEYGYSVDIEIDKNWNRNAFVPDYVVCKLAKDGQLMYKTDFRTEFDGDFDSDGTIVISKCLGIREKGAYQKQATKFDLKIAELLKLKEEHKLTHRAEKKALKAECEQLMAYREKFTPEGAEGIYANIPLIEENAKELELLAERIKEAVKAYEEAEAARAEAPEELEK